MKQLNEVVYEINQAGYIIYNMGQLPDQTWWVGIRRVDGMPTLGGTGFTIKKAIQNAWAKKDQASTKPVPGGLTRIRACARRFR